MSDNGSNKSKKQKEDSGIGGTICNHQCPMDFINMFGGEKF